MLQMLPVNNFEWIKYTSQFSEDFIKKTIMKKVMKDIFLKLMFNIQKNIYELHSDLQFLPERNKFERVEKLVTNLHDKTEYVVHIRNLKQSLNHGLNLKKVY